MTVSDIIHGCLNVSYYDTVVSIHRLDRTIKFKNYQRIPASLLNKEVKSFFVSYKYQTGICSGLEIYIEEEDPKP